MSILNAAYGAAGVLSGLVNPAGWLTGPMGRDADYAANRYLNNLASTPPPPAIIQAYYAGKFGSPGSVQANEILWSLLSEYGVHIDSTEAIATRRGEAWKATIDLALPILPVESWLSAYRAELYDVSRRDVSRMLGRSGILDSRQQSIAIDMGSPPAVSDTLRWYFASLITDKQATRYLKWAGATQEDVITAYKAALPPIDLGAAIILRNREVMSDLDWQKNLGMLGYGIGDNRDHMTRLLQQMPSPSDLILFSVREVWDQNVVDAFGYDNEFPPEFAYWMQKSGFNWSENIPNPGGQDTPGVNWPRAWWRSHWQTISPSQSYEMLHRLRPNRIARLQQIIPGVQPWTIEDVRRVLKIADYPAPFRDRLAAISYRVIGIRQIRSLVANKIWGPGELVEGFQDMGYSPADSQTLSDMSLAEADTKRLKALEQGQRSRVERGYEVGLISRDQAAVQLYMLSLISAKEHADFDALPFEQQLALARGDRVIQATLTGIDADLAVKLATQAIRAIRQAFLRGELDSDKAGQALGELGIGQQRQARYLDSWQWQRYGRGKSLAVSQLRTLAIRGLASAQEILQRLQKLGYPPVDALAILTLWQQDHSLYVAKAEQALAHTQAQVQRGLIHQQRELKRQLNDLRHQLAYNAPLNKLKKWLSKGLISQAEARMRMAALGHDAQFIAREIADATSKLEYTKKKPAERILETPLPPDTVRAGSG